jgi:eukaryotic-like serine/threonine-protein kinase
MSFRGPQGPTRLVGQTLGHYRILEQIGAGGMGVVYRAHDEQLDRDVALKVLPPGVLADETARNRFKREALALAKLNHPNIAMIFDFGIDGGRDFLVTEYIPGMTLDAKLTLGALPEKEAVALGLQLVQGLAAAHDRGVIHRDLKPGNLRVTADGRVKILDFGLALLNPAVSETAPTETLTQLHEIRGTLPYMTPEQLRGERADARSDVYATGTVLYELATAHRPFESKISTALAADIIHRLPPPPRKRKSGLSTKLEAVILKCLEKDPADRYQSARELQGDLERLSTGKMPLAVSRGRLRLLPAVVASALVGLLAASVCWYVLKKRPAHLPSAPRARRSVAVLGFKNLTGKPDEAWLSTALSEMLTTEMAAGGRLRTLSGEDVAQSKVNLSVADTDSLGRDTLVRIHKNLGCDFVVLGSYLDFAGQVRLDLRVQDANVGETVVAVSEVGTESQLLDLVSRSGQRLREGLGEAPVLPADAAAVKALSPSNPVANKLYAQGLSRLRVFDGSAARGFLQDAIATDPNFALAHSALAGAWSSLGYDHKAAEEAKKAFDLSHNLPREQQLWIEGTYRSSVHDWDKAIEIYRTLYEFAPDNLDYGLHFALAEDSAGKSREALVTISALRKLAVPEGDDPRIDLAEANADGSLGKLDAAQKSAQRAAQKGESQGAQLVSAQARLRQCWFSKDLGQPQQAIQACRNAKVIYDRVGDRNNAAWALHDIANILSNQGNWAEAGRLYEEALSVFRQIGNKNYLAGTLGDFAEVKRIEGDVIGARKMHEESLQIYREIGNTNDATIETINVANILEDQGDLVRAAKMYRESLALSRGSGNRPNEALSLTNLGLVFYDQGDLQAASKNFGDALQVASGVGDKHLMAYDLSGLGDVLWQRGDFAKAREKYKQSLAFRTGLGEKGSAAESRLSLAILNIDEGKLESVEPAIRQAAEEFHAEKFYADEASAEIALTKLFLERNQTTKARASLDQALAMATTSQNRSLQFAASITAAQVAAALGDPAKGLRSLHVVLTGTAKLGFERCRFEGRLAQGEIEIKSGQIAAGRAHLQALERDARAKDFGLIASKAGAALKG